MAELGSDETQPLLARLEDQTSHARVTPLPKAQLTALCIARLSDPISYTQIFPYINEFLTVLRVTDDPSKIGFYSGLVESVTSIAQVFTIFEWARLSGTLLRCYLYQSEVELTDIIGRRPVILAGALGLAIVSLVFGFCQTFAQVVIVRALAGMLTGNMSVYQVVLAEITDKTNQHTAYPIYGCIYPLGSTLGPLIGGFFSNLATKYPAYFGYRVLEAYPYFLPGLVCAVLAMLGFCLSYCYLEETLPTRGMCALDDDDLTVRSSEPTTMSIRELLSIPSVRTLAYSSFALSFLGTAHAVVFVLFCYTPIEKGGLGFSVVEIGYTLAMSSALFAGHQLFLMPYLLRTFDMARLYIFGMAVWPLSFAVIPFLNVIARLGADPDSTARSKEEYQVLLWVGITASQVVSRVAVMSFPTNLILVRSNSPSPSDLGAANGLNQLIMALARCVSPSFVSTLFALSVNRNLLGGHLWAVAMTLLSVWGYHISRKVENPGRNK
ncbi:major facilitator superfamily domain-containing protein [Mycena belliarum]|uniref:Major facilitator superfamily domain-containing protein n=1 Tax=Mycena belliarum TaxID=1033014 RepID=A0AAD6TUA3_9AGAR|nr:major facilitator superfamily domain-containing protein [Mycena belliae]